MPESVSQGEIYNAIACVDGKDEPTCVSSSVVWAPLHPANSEEMPPTLERKNGVVMFITKESDYEGQRQQYNVYRLIQYLENIEDPSSLPAMTFVAPLKDPTDTEPEWLYDDLIQNPAYETYEAFRRGDSLHGD
jgi:hypothetical protein